MPDSPAPPEDALLTDPPDGRWRPDVLPGFERSTFEPDETDRGGNLITLVRPVGTDQHPAARPVLLIHGWADYFYNAPLAHALSDAGYAVYAVDLHRYGRSLRPGQIPGWTDDLCRYDPDLETALAEIARHHRPRPAVIAHSTGGLVASLWAHRNPGQLEALVLNSPWLEMQGSSWVRRLARTIVDPVAVRRPEAMLRLPKVDFYWRTLSRDAEGEWDLNRLWRPPYSFDVPAAWLAAVIEGHARVARGLEIDAPILTLVSGRGMRAARYDAAMHTADVILDPEAMALRALRLGRRVTVHRCDEALHDVFASRADVRERSLSEMIEWLATYAPASERSTAPPYRRSRRA